MPSISYLQKLGPEHLEQIFESSKWIFDEDRDIAFEVIFLYVHMIFTDTTATQIFTSEDVELPRSTVADYLEQINPSVCARYLVFLIKERSEISPLFHDRLAELYLSMTLSAKRQGDDGAFFLF
jgi:hypothetical protein